MPDNPIPAAAVEEAAPIAWAYYHDGMNDGPDSPILSRRKFAYVMEPWTEVPLYALPHLAAPAGDVAGLVDRLRAMDYIHNRGPDYMPLEIPPSDLRLEAATALIAIAAERNALAERLRGVDPNALAAAYKAAGCRGNTHEEMAVRNGVVAYLAALTPASTPDPKSTKPPST